jgi:hypothetical protein
LLRQLISRRLMNTGNEFAENFHFSFYPQTNSETGGTNL